MTVPRAQEENYTNAVTPSPGIHSQAGISNELKTIHRELLDGPGQILFGPSKQGPLVRLRFLFHRAATNQQAAASRASKFHCSDHSEASKQPARHMWIPSTLPTRVLKSDQTGLTAALRYRFTGSVRSVTGGNRLNSNPNSNKFKNSHATGSDWFTDRFDRFTCRFDRWAFMGRPIFFLFLF